MPDTCGYCTYLFHREHGSDEHDWLCEALIDEDFIMVPYLAEDENGRPVQHERCPEKDGGEQ